MLAQLEGQDELLGSALILESSLVHARGIDASDVRMIVEHLTASPLGTIKVAILNIANVLGRVSLMHASVCIGTLLSSL